MKVVCMIRGGLGLCKSDEGRLGAYARLHGKRESSGACLGDEGRSIRQVEEKVATLLQTMVISFKRLHSKLG